jgi:hypothetical protein
VATASMPKSDFVLHQMKLGHDRSGLDGTSSVPWNPLQDLPTYILVKNNLHIFSDISGLIAIS